MSKRKSKAYSSSLSIEHFQSIGITVIVAMVLAMLNASIIIGKKETENLGTTTILIEIIRGIFLNWSFSVIGTAIFSVNTHNNIVERLINMEHMNTFPIGNSITGGIKYISNLLIAVINLVISIMLYISNGSKEIIIAIYILAIIFFFMSIISILIVEVQIQREKDYSDSCAELKIN